MSDQMGSVNNKLVPSITPSSTSPQLQEQHQPLPLQDDNVIFAPPSVQPLILSEDEEHPFHSSLTRQLDDDHRVPIALTNGAGRLRMLVDTDEDESGTEQKAMNSNRRVSWEDELRLYSDTEREDLAPALQHGRVPLQCTKPTCLRTAFPSSAEGREFRQCHNCTTSYCTRQCRRDDWDVHRASCETIRVQNIIRQTITCIKRLPKVMDNLSVVARRGYVFRGPGTVKMYFGSVEKAEQFLQQGVGALGQFGYIAWTELLPGELADAQYCAMVELCRNYNPENRFILYIVVYVEAEIPPSRSHVQKMERKIVGSYVKLRLTCEALEELQPTESSPYRRLLSSAPAPLTLILKATPLARYLDRAHIFERISNILCGRGISLRRQEAHHYKALRHYIEEGGTCATEGKGVRFDSINICARVPISGQPDMYIIMVDAMNESVEEVVQTNCMNVLVFDLINDSDEQLKLLLGLSEVDAVVPDGEGFAETPHPSTDDDEINSEVKVINDANLEQD